MAFNGGQLNSPLQTLAAQNPVQNNRIGQGLQAARGASLQQQIAGAPAGISNTTTASQQIGAQQAQAAGNIQTQVAQQTAQDQSKFGQEALAEQAKQAELERSKRSLSMKVKADNLTGKLEQVNRQLKSKLVDESISFEKDEMGRTLFNERQLMDYKLQSQQKEIALQEYEQQVQEFSQRRMTMLQLSYKKIEQELSQAQASNQQKLSQDQTKRLLVAKQNLMQKLQREAARNKSRAAAFQAGGMVIGAVIGTFIAPGAGTAAGASLGSAAGSAAASSST